MRDLSEGELDELDDLLDATPEPLQPLDVAMLDGYVCGVLVQPALIDSSAWLPPIFDLNGSPLPEALPAGWYERTTALIVRHHAALNHQLVDDGWFQPILFEPAPVAGEPLTPVEGAGPPSPTALEPLAPWVAGFVHAAQQFPHLLELDDGEVVELLDRLLRHLPAQTDDEREVQAQLAREYPLVTLDDAIEDLITIVVELFDRTHDARYRVEPIRREAPKVGRNEPCPCGSGRKFKLCHGASAT
jgi:uncharacterized protein